MEVAIVAGLGGVDIDVVVGAGPGAGEGIEKPVGFETGDILLDKGIEGEGPKAAIAGFGVKFGSGSAGPGEGAFLSYFTGLLTESMILGT
jgi:hypothetical protein